MLVNVAKIGKSGTGMWVYSLKFIDSIATQGKLDGIICADANAEAFSKYNCKVIKVPDSISNTSKISKVRPFLWFIYSFILRLKLSRLKGNPLIVSTTHHGLPWYNNQIITIHDLRPYFYPDSYLQKFYFRYILPLKSKSCKHILTVSNTVKDTLVKHYDLLDENVSVVYNSINVNDFKYVTKIDKARDKYLLAVGGSWKHKNVHKIIENYTSWSSTYRLVVVCGRTTYSDELKKLVDRFSIEGKVSFVHEVSFDKLKALYAGASALIYPSLDEGFGIPPLEAFASKIPVIVSDIPVFHEILSEYAIYLDTENPIEWTRAINKVDLFDDTSLNKLREFAETYDNRNMNQMIEEWLCRIDKSERHL